MNHLVELYDGETRDILGHGYALVGSKAARAPCWNSAWFAQGSGYREQFATSATTEKECLVPGPGPFWPKHLGTAPMPQLIVSLGNPPGPLPLEIPVDPHLLAAGDHNGSTYFEHASSQGTIEVTLQDGWWAVFIGLAAQRSAGEGRAIDLANEFAMPN
ncbi:hypothetical protein ACVDG5_008690 [Mesorhizobium sp. ORM6]